jgi:hypothetical protein
MGAGGFLVIGIIVFAAGTIGFLASARRGFCNTNQYGVEQAQNFGSAMGAGCLRIVCIFLAFIGFFATIGGLFAVLGS